MNSVTTLSQIHSITNRILDAKSNAYRELFSTCDELYNSLLRINEINSLDEKNRGHLSLESGAALGLTWAAMCIKDIIRTKRFMDGIYAAVKDILRVHPDKTIHILYAGTGPFATLILPLTARFSAQQLQFTLLEVNESSYNSLQKLVKILHLEKYIHLLEKADATKWQLQAGEHIDIFICEVMQGGLKSEPQVAICMNIIPQLSPGTIMIPQQIILDAALINEKIRMNERFQAGAPPDSIQYLDTIFILRKETILAHVAASQQAGEKDFPFPEKHIFIPIDIISHHPSLFVLTELQIYDQEKLLIDESQLTIPLKLTRFSEPYPNEIKIQYQTGNQPGIQFITQKS